MYDDIRAQGISADRFDVRIYTDIPSLSMLIDAEQAVVTPVSVASLGGTSPFLIVRKTGSLVGFYAEYSNHFDKIFSGAIPILGTNLAEAYLKTTDEEKQRVSSLPDDLTQWLGSRLFTGANASGNDSTVVF